MICERHNQNSLFKHRAEKTGVGGEIRKSEAQSSLHPAALSWYEKFLYLWIFHPDSSYLFQVLPINIPDFFFNKFRNVFPKFISLGGWYTISYIWPWQVKHQEASCPSVFKHFFQTIQQKAIITSAMDGLHIYFTPKKGKGREENEKNVTVLFPPPVNFKLWYLCLDFLKTCYLSRIYQSYKIYRNAAKGKAWLIEGGEGEESDQILATTVFSIQR